MGKYIIRKEIKGYKEVVIEAESFNDANSKIETVPAEDWKKTITWEDGGRVQRTPEVLKELNKLFGREPEEK